jgi:hypothetical protein
MELIILKQTAARVSNGKCLYVGNVNWEIQWKPLIMIILGLALFDNNNRLITLSGRYKNLHYLI